MKHFINKEFLAPNVLTVPIDGAIVAEFEELVGTAHTNPEYLSRQPKWNSDIRWISATSESGFAKFQSAFDRLGLAAHVREYLDIERDVRLYAGFLHTRSHCTGENFHVDWVLTNNEAFTMLTPISGADGQTLLYKKLTGEVAEYEYKQGEAIIFGDHFVHSTPTGSWDPPFPLLVFNFGTDKMKHWDKVKKTTATQCRLIQRPDGQFEVNDLKAKGDVDKQPAPSHNAGG